MPEGEPIHSGAFEKFIAATENRLEAIIAFGLFLESEAKWAKGELEKKGTSPDGARYSAYHEIYLTRHEIHGYIDEAKRVLQRFGNNLLQIEQPKFLSLALSEYRRAAERGEAKFRRLGMLEAFGGAFIYSLFLIAAVTVAHWLGIDVAEVARKVTGAP